MSTAAIFGATGTGKRVYTSVKDKYDVRYFIDEDTSLVGKDNFGVPIYNVEHLLQEKPDVVIMGKLTGLDDSVEFLSENGFEEYRIITNYVDLPIRARQSALKCISSLIQDKEAAPCAELGVYRGDFAKIINETFPDRKLFLFDTFEGFPEQDMNYEVENKLVLDKVGKLSNTSVDYVLGKMPHPEMCIVKKGYFPDTAAGMENEKFAFVNIDVDLYKPIKSGLEFFYPRMIKGGYIFVHDYFSLSYGGSKKAVDEFATEHNVSFTPIGDTLSVAICI